jgi:hypothetical protein
MTSALFMIARKNQLWHNKVVQAETAVVTKRNVLKSQLPLIIVAASVVLLTLMWLAYRTLGHSKCDSIFEQTADHVQANLEFIKIKGELALGREKVHELTEASQKVALHLKSCCIAQQAGILNAEQFQVCTSGAKDYQNQIIQVATNIKEANAAEEQQKPDLARQKTDAAKEAASKIVNTEKALARTTVALPASTSVNDPNYYSTVTATQGISQSQIEITIDQPPAGQIYRIGPEPSMPQIKAHARVVGVTPDPSSTTTFTWDVNIHYDPSQSPYGPRRPPFDDDWQGIGTTIGSAVLVISPSAFSGKIRGGDLKLSARGTVNGTPATGEKSGYKILGPPRGSATDTQVRQQLHTILTNSTLRKVASLESGGHQFDNRGYPLWSRDNLGGVGVMQVTNPQPSVDEVWNWQKNAMKGKSVFIDKKGAANRLAGRVERNVNQIVSEDRQRHHLSQITIVVPPLTSHGGTDFDLVYDNVVFSNTVDQVQQDAIRCYNGVGADPPSPAQPMDPFAPPGLHEFQLDRTSPLVPVLEFLNPSTARARWRHVNDRAQQFAPRPCPGNCDYVIDVLSAEDLPH